MTDDDKSLGDQHTFDGETPGKPDAAADSLGDEMTYAGGANVGPSSLGDEMTFSGVAEGLDDDLVDDGMQIIDLDERYTTESVLGKGGMGEVLLATDKRLDRQVAIKRVLGKAARSAKAWQRFENGAKTIAKLNHPNIVQVYEYGRAKDGPFMILECVTGGSLLDKCQQGPIPLEEAIDIACQLCDGIGKAHAAGIVHRDIKPANVLMTEDGIPKLNDFDLAKEQAGDSGMTQEGAVLGTVAFMPPEQQKDAALVDERSDLWSLAATLYQMVTGESPKVIRLKKVPPQLQDVLDKALEDEKDNRYQNAREFRDALRGSLTAQVQPAVVSMAELGAGECPQCHSRNDSGRKFCNGCGSSLRVLCIECNQEIPVWEKFCAECGANQPDLIASRLESLKQQRDQAEKLRSEYSYETALQIAQKLTAIEDERLWQHKPWAEEFVQSVKQEWERQLETAQQNFEESKKHRDAFDYNAAIEAIEVIPEPMRSPLVVSYLRRLESAKQELRDLIPTIKERVKSRDLDGLLTLVDRAVELRGKPGNLAVLREQLTDRKRKRILGQFIQERGTLKGHTNYVSSVAFSPDGKTIASGSWDQTIKLWDVKRGKKLNTLTGHTKIVGSVAFSPDGQSIVSGSADQTNKTLWDVQSGKELTTLTGHTSSVSSVAFSPDGKTIASGSSDKTIKLWDVESGKELTTLTGHTSNVNSVAFSPDGQSIASGSSDNSIKLWDVQSGKELKTLMGHTSSVSSVAFSPDGQSIASGSWDKTIKLWDVESGKELTTLTGHKSSVSSVAFSPDGQLIASGSSDNSIILWDVQSGKEPKTLTGHTSSVSSVAFSPDGKTVASGSHDKTIKLWNVGDYLKAIDYI